MTVNSGDNCRLTEENEGEADQVGLGGASILLAAIEGLEVPMHTRLSDESDDGLVG